MAARRVSFVRQGTLLTPPSLLFRAGCFGRQRGGHRFGTGRRWRPASTSSSATGAGGSTSTIKPPA
jgi:hypothetical protein